MNKQKFIEYLRKPATLNEQTLEALERAIEQYPYFQSARTLLAKGSKINKSPRTSSHISSAAIYATDRVLLKRYINDELIFLNPLQAHESHEADHERDLGQAIKSNRQATTKQKIRQVQREAPDTAPPKKVIKPPVTTAPAPQKEKEKDPAPTSSNLDHIIEELYRDMEELKISRAKFRELEDKLEEDEAVEKAVINATKTGEPKTEPEAQKAENEHKPLEAKPSEEKPQVSKPKKPAKNKAADKPKSSADAPATGKKTDQSDLEEKDADAPPRKKTDQEHIIADFIKKNPSISPADGKLKTDEDLSGDSTVLHPDLASEYLAEIYLNQGKKETAKKIYENLMRKFPEKSVYFAEIIKKLN